MDINTATKKILVIALSIAVLTVPVVFAGFLDMWDSVTGRATSGGANMTITLGNTAPVIYNVTMVSSGTGLDPAENTYTDITLWFLANDSDGVANLDDASAEAVFTRYGRTRSNASCTLENDLGDGYGANYTCTVRMWYFDYGGSWTINVSIDDINSAEGYNDTETFTYGTGNCIVLSPRNLTWSGSISTSSTNRLASSNITINNTCNANITSGNITINATELRGHDTQSQMIYAENFSANIDWACAGAQDLLNNTKVNIPGSVLPPGNNSLGEGQEKIAICLKELPPTLSSQTYSTAGSRNWIFTSHEN